MRSDTASRDTDSVSRSSRTPAAANLLGDQAGGAGVADRLEEGASAALDAQPPQRSPHPHVDVGDVGRAALLGGFVVHPHDLGAVDVDDLLVEEVLADGGAPSRSRTPGSPLPSSGKR